MEDSVQHPGDVHVLGHVVLNELESIAQEVGEVLRRPGDVVVDGHDGVPFPAKPVAQMGTEKAGGTRDEDPQSTSLLPIE